MGKNINLYSIAEFADEDKARAFLEKLRWPEGAVCPHCGSVESYKLNPKPDSERPVRKGVYKCKYCKKQFTVTVGTIFEGSHIKIGKWLAAIYLMCSSKKGISAHQLHRSLGITYKSAWFMAHRIRYAMEHIATDKLSGIIEADETYIGGKAKGVRGRGAGKKMIVASLVERNGDVRSVHVERVNAKTLKGFIKQNATKESIIMTDEFKSYKGLDSHFSGHYIVTHSAGEYRRGICHTNTIEGYFSILKRGVNGTFHHISKQHLTMYLSEFDFRYNHRKLSDGSRTEKAIKGFEGKRLYYRDSLGVIKK